MKNTISLLVLGLLLVTSACSPSAQSGGSLVGEITISGAYALYPLLMRWAEDFQKINPEVRFDIATGGAEKGMEDLLAQKTDIGMVSREITADEMSQGAFPILVAKDAVFPMISAENPVVTELFTYGVTRETLVKIFISDEIKTWGQVVGKSEITDEIHVYTRTEICGAADAWGRYLGGGQTDLLGDGRVGDPGIIRALANDPFGIGYCNQVYAYSLGNIPPEGTLILPIDLNANGQADPEEILDTFEKAASAVAAGLYPAPPSRFLYLVTNGKPSDLVQAFLLWALIDGQDHVDRCGYMALPSIQIEETLQRIH